MVSKQMMLQQIIDEFFKKKEAVQAVIVTNEDGLPICSRINPNSKELEYFLSAIISSLSNTFTNMISTLKMKEPDDIYIDLKTGMMIIRNINLQISIGVLIKKQPGAKETSESLVKALSEEIEQVLVN